MRAHYSSALLRRCLLLAALTVPLAAQAGGWTVRFDGAGPLKVGMRFDTVNKVLGQHMQRVPVELRGTPNCFQLEPAGQPGLLLMFVDDVLQRVDVMEEGIASERGIGLGDPVEKVMHSYGEAVSSTPQAYDDSERTLTVRAGAGKYAIRFDTSKGKVGAIYAGGWKEVQLSEGCL